MQNAFGNAANADDVEGDPPPQGLAAVASTSVLMRVPQAVDGIVMPADAVVVETTYLTGALVNKQYAFRISRRVVHNRRIIGATSTRDGVRVIVVHHENDASDVAHSVASVRAAISPEAARTQFDEELQVLDLRMQLADAQNRAARPARPGLALLTNVVGRMPLKRVRAPRQHACFGTLRACSAHACTSIACFGTLRSACTLACARAGCAFY